MGAKDVPYCQLTFADCLERWIKQAGANIKPNTYRTYQAMVTNHIVPYFKQHPVLLQELKPTDLDAYYQAKQQPGSKQNGKGTLSAMSIRHHHQVISKALNDAVHDSLIQYNPATTARKPKTERYNASFLNPAEIDPLLALFLGNVAELPVNLCAVYGFRRSEVLGLKWENIDFKLRSITIAETLQQGATGDDGNVISPNYLTKTFHNVIAKSSLPNVRLHDLRHSAASNLLNMGFSIVQVQQWLGHGSASTTLNFYAHVDKNSKLDMAEAMEKALKKPRARCRRGDRKLIESPEKADRREKARNPHDSWLFWQGQ